MFNKVRCCSKLTSNYRFENLPLSAQSILRRHRLLVACIAVIIAVSALDTYLVCTLKHVIVEFERNPICLALIQRDPEDLSWFIGGKMLGNLAVVSVLVCLFRYRYRNRKFVALSVAGFQVFLTLYLCCADPFTGFLSFDGLFSHSQTLYRKSVDSLLIHLAALSAIAAAISVVYRIRNPRLILRNRAALTDAKQFFGILR